MKILYHTESVLFVVILHGYACVAGGSFRLGSSFIPPLLLSLPLPLLLNYAVHSTTMQLGLSESLSSLVARRFATARDAGHLTFSATHLSIIHSSGIPVPAPALCPIHIPRLISHPVPTPLLPGPRQEAIRRPKARWSPNRAQTRPLPRPVARPPARPVPAGKPSLHSSPEQIPRHPQPLHPRDEGMEAAGGYPGGRRLGSRVRVREGVGGAAE
jgi:hypothetical protein